MEKTNNAFERHLLNHIQHYNHQKYWKMRQYVVDKSKKNKIRKYIYLIKIKKMDAYHNASMGTNINGGAVFHSAPILPHGLNGIFISHDCEIGKNVVIYHQVTIGSKKDGGKAAKIGNNVTIYPGVKIVGEGIEIGDNCIIGANAVVTHSFPSNSVIVGIPARKIK